MEGAAKARQVREQFLQLKDDVAVARSKQLAAEKELETSRKETADVQGALEELQERFGEVELKSSTQARRIQELEHQVSEGRAMIKRQNEEVAQVKEDRSKIVNDFTQRFDKLVEQRNTLAQRFKAAVKGPSSLAFDVENLEISEMTNAVQTPLGPDNHPEPTSGEGSSSGASSGVSSGQKSEASRLSPDAKKSIDFGRSEGGGDDAMVSDSAAGGAGGTDVDISQSTELQYMASMSMQNTALARLIDTELKPAFPEAFAEYLDQDKEGSVFRQWYITALDLSDFVQSMIPARDGDEEMESAYGYEAPIGETHEQNHME